jgi:hypothetical protein
MMFNFIQRTLYVTAKFSTLVLFIKDHLELGVIYITADVLSFIPGPPSKIALLTVQQFYVLLLPVRNPFRFRVLGGV